jgi:dUTP pyrophosphatase
MIEVKIKKLDKDAVLPTYGKEGDAAMDLTAISKGFDGINIVYGTGLAMEIPYGYVGLIFPRSSVSKKELTLANSVGVIDAGYRGEIICKFKTTNPYHVIESADIEYEIGDRVAQIMIIPRPEISFVEVDELSDSERGDDGFGSTGK